jgi:hypothetical protein
MEFLGQKLETSMPDRFGQNVVQAAGVLSMTQRIDFSGLEQNESELY